MIRHDDAYRGSEPAKPNACRQYLRANIGNRWHRALILTRLPYQHARSSQPCELSSTTLFKKIFAAIFNREIQHLFFSLWDPTSKWGSGLPYICLCETFWPNGKEKSTGNRKSRSLLLKRSRAECFSTRYGNLIF